MTGNLENLRAACEQWSRLLGPDRVTIDGPEFERRARTTFATATAPVPLAFVKPTKREQIPEIVRIAACNAVALYPVSIGRSWGWGDSCPAGENQVVLDLSAVDRIITIDDDAGYAAVEPGVTQRQLANRLAGTDWVADCTSAGPRTSVLGNLVERGIGLSRFGDRFSHVAGLEAVLADGTVVRTGHFPNASAPHSLPWLVGPAITGLFTQSNYGIVTEVGLWLLPREEVASGWLCTFADSDLETMVNVLRRLVLRGVLAGTPHNYRLAGPSGSCRWLAMSSITGSAESAILARRTATAAVGAAGVIADLPDVNEDISPSMIGEILERLKLPDTPIMQEYIQAARALARGRPWELSPLFLRAYVGGNVQGERPADSSDPLDADYGLYFLWPTAAPTGAEVRRLVTKMLPIFESHGLPPLITINILPPHGRIIGVIRVAFDKSDPASAAAGEACYYELFDTTVEAGFPPARCTTIAMDRLGRRDPEYWSLILKLKASLDPDGVIAPGRYVPPTSTG